MRNITPVAPRLADEPFPSRHATRRASQRQFPIRYSMRCPADEKTLTIYQLPLIDTIFLG